MRYSNWLEKLYGVIEASKSASFDYGTMNCGIFAAQCADAVQVNSSLEAYLRAQFHDEASARAWVEEGGGIEAIVTANSGDPVPWPQAMRGDLAMVPTQEGDGMGVVLGTTIMLLAPKGLTHVNLDKAIKCWRIT